MIAAEKKLPPKETRYNDLIGVVYIYKHNKISFYSATAPQYQAP